jgi:hypothetical protein
MQPTMQGHYWHQMHYWCQHLYQNTHTHTKFRIKVIITSTKVISPRTVLAQEITLMTCTGEVSSSNLSSVSGYLHRHNLWVNLLPAGKCRIGTLFQLHHNTSY